MSFKDEVDAVIREEQRKQERLKRRVNPNRKAVMQQRHPTYFAVIAARLIMRFSKNHVPENGNGQKKSEPVREEVTLATIVKEDVQGFWHRLFNGKMPKTKNKPKDSWENWKEYFDESAPINVPPKYEPPPEPETAYPEFPEIPPDKQHVDPDVEAFFEDPDVEVKA